MQNDEKIREIAKEVVKEGKIALKDIYEILETYQNRQDEKNEQKKYIILFSEELDDKPQLFRVLARNEEHAEEIFTKKYQGVYNEANIVDTIEIEAAQFETE